MSRLKGARLLLSNDDGINADGFGALERIAAALSDDVWVVAPESEQSAASHSLTIHRPLRVRQVGAKRYTVDGTPTDCVLLAINHIMQDKRPDFVLSGVNHGQNLAEDVTYSGTIAAAMEATLLGVPAIALSQVIQDGHAPDWQTSERWGPDVVRRCLEAGFPKEVLINVNFPAVDADAVTGVTVAPHGQAKVGDELAERTDPRGRKYIWIGTARSGNQEQPGTDIEAIGQRRVAVTPLHLDLTHRPTLAPLAKAFE